MQLRFTLFCALLTIFTGFSQSPFEKAYSNTDLVPAGLLEAIAWTNTRMEHLDNVNEGCAGIPVPYGIMGLHDNGKNYFNRNGELVAQLSGITIADQKTSAENQILAYAIAFEKLLKIEAGKHGGFNNPIAIRSVLHELSEIPDSGIVNALARDIQVYGIMTFMNSAKEGKKYNFKQHQYDLLKVFGKDNLAVLSSQKIELKKNEIIGGNKKYSVPVSTKSIEYGPAIWNPAATCNFSSRNGVAISAITIHTIQGTYAGAISWAQNCSSSVSYHYVIRSSDGQVTQMVSEADKAWHVGTENPYTIGYEHEGYVNNSTWYTNAMISSSAALSRDVVQSGYGIPPLRTYYGPGSTGSNVLGGCTKIKGHQHFPNQTHVDPGIYWDWEKYYQLINNNPVFNTLSGTSGTLYDTGGAAGNYQDDEREFWRIQPLNAQSITLTFNSFNVESGYDNLFIYDGDSTDAPLIGVYTGTNSPGVVTSTGGVLLLEFRSDCGTVASGWDASYSTTLQDVIPPTTVIQASSTWQTDDFNVTITDADNLSGIAERFYLVGEKLTTDNDWNADGNAGFAYESFEDNSSNWINVTGTYSITNNAFGFTDTNEQNSNAYMSVTQTINYNYLYEWDQTITSSGSNQRAGLHFFVDNPNLPNRGNSYFIYLRESTNKIQLYSVSNDVFTLELDAPAVINVGQSYNCKILYNPTSGVIDAYIDNVLAASWQDPTPLTNGGFISLRTGGCAAVFDNVHVYQSRSTNVNVPAGPTDLLSIESLGAVPTGMMRSLTLDGANNWSQFDEELFLLDFSTPLVNYLYDGTANDIDTFSTSTIEANWSMDDPHSGIMDYQVAIGTLPAVDDVYPWTSTGINPAFSTVLPNPIYNQLYYISVRAVNNANLVDQFIADGQRYINNVGIEELNNYLNGIELYPNPVENILQFSTFEGELEIRVYAKNGKLCLSEKFAPNQSIDLSNLSSGTYDIILLSGSSFVVKQIIKQ